MSRTYRHDNGMNNGRDDKNFGAKCAPSFHPRGFDSFLDDHGHYGAGGARKYKKFATRARRNYYKKQDEEYED